MEFSSESLVPECFLSSSSFDFIDDPSVLFEGLGSFDSIFHPASSSCFAAPLRLTSVDEALVDRVLNEEDIQSMDNIVMQMNKPAAAAGSPSLLCVPEIQLSSSSYTRFAPSFFDCSRMNDIDDGSSSPFSLASANDDNASLSSSSSSSDCLRLAKVPTSPSPLPLTVPQKKNGKARNQNKKNAQPTHAAHSPLDCNSPSFSAEEQSDEEDESSDAGAEEEEWLPEGDQSDRRTPCRASAKRALNKLALVLKEQISDFASSSTSCRKKKNSNKKNGGLVLDANAVPEDFTDEYLFHVSTKELNRILKNSNMTSAQIVAVRKARRRVKNRNYATTFRSRQRLHRTSSDDDDDDEDEEEEDDE